MGSKERNPNAAPSPGTGGGQDSDREALIRECEDALEKLVNEQGEGAVDFESYERRLLELVHEIARRRLEKKLQSMADGFANRVVIDHNNDWYGCREGTAFAFRRHCPGTTTYHSLVGPLRVRRYTYRECGALTSCVPLELAAGLIERMTPSLAKCVAIGYAHMPLRTCEELMLAGGLKPPSRSTLDRAARDLGDYAVTCNAEIEPLVRANEWIPPNTHLIAVGLDRVAVPMRQGEELAGLHAYSQQLRRSRPKPKPRTLLQGPVQWRMDYVGTVAFLDENRTLLTSRKYRLPGSADISAIIARVLADVRHALMQRPVELAVIQDGAPELWSAIQNALQREPSIHRWTEVLDWYHLDERLTKCLDLCVEPSARAAKRDGWRTTLLDTKGGANRVVRGLRAKRRDVAAAEAEQLTVHINYIEHNKRRMNYCEYRARGIPIGSGITEGACKSVVNVRAKRSGQRWSQRGLSAALHLRTVHESGRFDAFWSFFSRRYRATHIVPLGPDDQHRAY